MDIDYDTETEWSTDLSADDSFGNSGELQVDVNILRQIINHKNVSAHDLNKIGYCLVGNPKSTPFKGLPNKQQRSYRDVVMKLLDEQFSFIKVELGRSIRSASIQFMVENESAFDLHRC